MESSERRLFNFALWKTAAEFCLSVGLVSMRTFWCTSARMTSENITFSIIALTVGVEGLRKRSRRRFERGITADVRNDFRRSTSLWLVQQLPLYQSFSYERPNSLPRSSVTRPVNRTPWGDFNSVITEFLLQREAKRKNFRWADLVQKT